MRQITMFPTRLRVLKRHRNVLLHFLAQQSGNMIFDVVGFSFTRFWALAA
jgi:hypothetical protein